VSKNPQWKIEKFSMENGNHPMEIGKKKFNFTRIKIIKKNLL